MDHFNPFDDPKEIDFTNILSYIKDCSFFQYFAVGQHNAELQIYFDTLGKTERFVYTLYFDKKTLNMSRCHGWNGKVYTKGGGAHIKVATIRNKGRKEFDNYMKEFSLKKYGYEFNPVICSLK